MTTPDPDPDLEPRPVASEQIATAARGQAAAARLKERIYANITLAAVLVSLSETEATDHVEAALTVAVTALGIWLATLVADEQSHRSATGRGANRAEVRTALHVSSPLLLSAMGPLALIGLSALGAVELGTALLISSGMAVASLFLWGWRTGLKMGNGPLSALVSGLLDTAIGLGVVAVKLLSGH